DVVFLVHSLGGVAYWRTRAAAGRLPGRVRGRPVHHRSDSYPVDIRLPASLSPFRLTRKRAVYDAIGRGRPMRFIESLGAPARACWAWTRSSRESTSWSSSTWGLATSCATASCRTSSPPTSGSIDKGGVTMAIEVFAADEQGDHPVETLRWVQLARSVLRA